MDKPEEGSPFIRKLTREDCAKGFHDFRNFQTDKVTTVEQCRTCKQTFSFPTNLSDKNEKETIKKWQEKHKLDVLQPAGKTMKDFIYYYGDPYAPKAKSNKTKGEEGSSKTGEEDED